MEKVMLKVEDIVTGEIYQDYQNGNIVRWDRANDEKHPNDGGGPHIGNARKDFELKTTGNFTKTKLCHTTPEEKHWLNECIKAKKFIPLSEIKPIVLTYEIY